MAISDADLAAFNALDLPRAKTGGFQGAPKKKGRGGTATSLISEGAGTAGALTGAAIGTAILPGVGTLLGAGIGGFAGGFGGRAAENKIRDGEYRLEDALMEGAISGVAGAGPIRASKALIQGTKALGKKGAGTMATSTLEDAVTSAAQQPAKTSMQGRMIDAGNDLLVNQYGAVPSRVARATNPKKTFGELANLGLTKPQDVERVASGVTGSQGIINKAVISAVGNSSTVPTDSVQKTLLAAIDDYGLVDSNAKSVTNMVNAQMNKLRGGSSPSKVFDVMKSLEKQAAHLQGKSGANYSMPTPERVDIAKTLLRVRDDLENSLYNAAGANKNLGMALTPQLRDELVALHPSSPEWTNFVDGTVMKADTVKKLRSTMAPFVRARQHIDEADIADATIGGRMANTISNGGSVTGAMAMGATQLMKGPASRMAGQTLRKAAGADLSSPVIKGPALGMGGIIGREAGAAGIRSQFSPQDAGATGLEGALMQADPSGMGGTENQTPWLENGTSGPLDPNTMQPVQTSPYSRDNLMYDIQRDPKNAAKYIAYYKELDEIFGVEADEGSQLTSDTRKMLNMSSNGQNTINQLQAQFEAAGGGGGKLGGFIQNKMANVGLDKNAGVYNDLSGGSVSQLAKALGETGTLSDSDRAIYASLLPKLTESPQQAALKWRAIQQRLEVARQNAMMYGAGNMEEPQTQGAY
jgi:hypothetical protein